MGQIHKRMFWTVGAGSLKTDASTSVNQQCQSTEETRGISQQQSLTFFTNHKGSDDALFKPFLQRQYLTSVSPTHYCNGGRQLL